MAGFFALILCQIIGDLIARSLSIPIPGPILGILLLLLYFLWRGEIPEDIARAGDLLIAWLPFLILPAGAGIILYLGALASEAFAILVALLVSTVIALGCTALIARALIRRRETRAISKRQSNYKHSKPSEKFPTGS